MAASHHGDTPYSGNSVTPVPVTPYTTSVDVNFPLVARGRSQQSGARTSGEAACRGLVATPGSWPLVYLGYTSH